MMDYSYSGSGKVSVREYGAAAGRKEIGNCVALSLSIDEDTKDQVDKTQPGGGVYNSFSRINLVTMNMTLTDFSPENLARSLFGASTTVASSTVTDEVVTAYHDSFVPFAKIPSGSIVVTNSAGTTTYVLNTDYEERPGGIFILSTGAITDGQSLKVDYACAAQYRIETLTNSAKDYEIFFDGLNEARSGKKVTVRLHRVKIGPAREFGLIQDEHGRLEVSGKVQKDTNISSAGLSQYITVAMVA